MKSFLTAGAAVLAMLSVGTPALAEDDAEFAWVTASMEMLVNVATDATTPKPVKITIRDDSPVPAESVVVTIDASKVPDSLRVQLPGTADGCVVSGAVATCQIPQLAANASAVLVAGLLPGDQNASEWSGTMTVTTQADNMPTKETSSVDLQLLGPGVDLVVDEVPDMTLAAGESQTVPVRLANTGTVAAVGVVVVISTTAYIEQPNQYTNCEYEPDDLALACVFEQPIEPGDVFAISPSTPLKVKVSDTAPGPDTYGGFLYAIPLVDDQPAPEAKSGGPALKLVKTATVAPGDDLNGYDNESDFSIDVPKNDADSVAIGASIAGAVGETKTVEVGIRNDGPHDTLTPGEAWASNAKVTLPQGVTALTVSDRCAPIVDGRADWDQMGKAVGLSYQCYPSAHLTAGETVQFPFTVKITGSAGAAGSIVVDGGVQDPDTANNTAAIELAASGGGGGLPVTGSRVGLLAALGALLVAAGAVSIVAVRRRRIQIVAE